MQHHGGDGHEAGVRGNVLERQRREGAWCSGTEAGAGSAGTRGTEPLARHVRAMGPAAVPRGRHGTDRDTMGWMAVTWNE